MAYPPEPHGMPTSTTWHTHQQHMAYPPAAHGKPTSSTWHTHEHPLPINSTHVPMRSALPTHEQHGLPTHEQHGLPTHEQHALPTHAQHTLPTHAQHALPTHAQHALPTHAQHALPTHAQHALPTHAQHALPTHAQHALPTHEQNALLAVEELEGIGWLYGLEAARVGAPLLVHPVALVTGGEQQGRRAPGEALSAHLGDAFCLHVYNIRPACLQPLTLHSPPQSTLL
ncbi:unnamed protein product [Closterium sp. Naga37s-1]|nr:unnamed protein product [Closterium sp. Naga37s-1]